MWIVAALAGAAASACAQPPVPSDSYTVAPGQTLLTIARSFQPIGVSLSVQEIALAIFEANTPAFPRGPHHLRAGERLRLPGATGARQSGGQAFSLVPKGRLPVVVAQNAIADAPTADAPIVTDAVATEAVVAVPPAPPATLRFADHPDKVLAEAQMSSRDFSGAYERLKPLEAEFAGDPDFDYLFGIACLDSGHPSEAVFSLQRAVAANPGFAGARLELARAYYTVGDDQDALREFEIVSRQKPPPQAAAAIAQYRAAIENRTVAERPAWRAVADVSGGYDSNANGGTDSGEFLGFTLNDASRRNESSFFGARAEAGYSLPLRPNLRWQSGLELSHRHYPQASFVDASIAELGTGLVVSDGGWSGSANLSARALNLDGDFNQATYAADLGGRRVLSDTLAVLGSLRAARLSYDQDVDVQDVDQLVGGLALQWRLDPASGLELVLGPVLGQEDARQASSPYGRDLAGGRASLSGAYAGSRWRASLGGLNSDYDGQFFGRSREDRQWAAQVEVEVPKIVGSWMLRPSLAWVDNRSNLGLFDYERVEASLSLVRGFR